MRVRRLSHAPQPGTLPGSREQIRQDLAYLSSRSASCGLKNGDSEVSTSRTSRQELIDGLRAVAAFYEEHPQAYDDGMTLTLSMYVSGCAADHTLATMASALGTCDRSRSEEYRSVAKKFSSRVRLEFFRRASRK
jgi:hypothetical protein